MAEVASTFTAIAWWSSGAVTLLVGQGASKVLPWPVAFLIGGATAGFTHRTVLASYESLRTTLEALRTTLEALGLSLSPSPPPPPSQSPPPDVAEAAMDALRQSIPKVPKKIDPIPNEGLLSRPKRRLGMYPIVNPDDDTIAINFDTVATLDGIPERIVTPLEAPSEPKFLEASYDSFVDAREDDPAVKQDRDLDADELIRRPTIAGPFKARSLMNAQLLV